MLMLIFWGGAAMLAWMLVRGGVALASAWTATPRSNADFEWLDV